MSDNTLTITGMSCGHCLNAVNKALSTVPGIQVLGVRIGQAELRTEDAASLAAAKSAIEDAGYRVDSIVSA